MKSTENLKMRKIAVIIIVDSSSAALVTAKNVKGQTRVAIIFPCARKSNQR